MASKTAGNAKAAASKAAKEASAAAKKTSSSSSPAQQTADSSALAAMNKVRAQQGLAPQTAVGVKAPSGSSGSKTSPSPLNTPQVSTARPYGNLTEGTKVREVANPDGTKKYEIYGSSGTVYDTVAGDNANWQSALARQQQIQGGSTPQVSGRPNTFPIDALPSEKATFGAKILNPAQLKEYTDMGLTENDIIRSGKDIYFKNGITPETLKARSASSVPFTATPPAAGENVSPDTLQPTTTDTSLLTGWDLDSSDPNAFVKSINTLFDMFKSETQKRLEKKMEDATTKLEGYVDQLGNRTARYQELEGKYKIEDQYQQLMEINLQMAQKQAEYEQLFVDTEGQTIPQGLLIGQGAQAQRQAAADMGMLAARASAIQGNIQLAQNLVDRSIEIEFGGIQAQIDATRSLISTYGDQLSAEESKQAAKVGIVLDERQRILDDQKEEKKSKYELMLEVAKAGGDPSIIDMNKSLEDNIVAAKSYLLASSDESSVTDAQILSAAQTLVNNGLASNLNDAVAQVRQSLGLSGGTTSTGSTTGVTGFAGFDDYVSSIGNGTITSEPGDDMGELYGGGHHGVDIDGHTGDAVTSPVSGTIVEAVNDQGGSTTGYGNYVKIQDSSGNYWYLGHFSNVTAQVGQTVSVGDYLGAMGKSGNTSGTGSSDPDKGSHLHLEVRSSDDSTQLDPRTVLSGQTQAPSTSTGTGDYVRTLTPKQNDVANTIMDNARQDPDFDDFITIRNSYEQIYNSAQNPSAAGDLSMIFGYMKMLDPTSVVREGEQASAQNAAGVPEQVRNLYNRLMTGERLSDDQRSDFLGRAQQMYELRYTHYQDAYTTYYNQLQAAGIDPDLFLRDYSAKVGTASSSSSTNGGSSQDYSQAEVDAMRAQLQSGEILVQDRQTGEIGALPESEYNSSQYIKL